MSLPRPKWYNAEALAQCWKVDVSMIRSYNLSGQLIAKILYKRVDGTGNQFYPENYGIDDVWLAYDGLKYVDKVYKLEDVERFEKENDMHTPHAQDASPLAEKTQNNKPTTPQSPDTSIDDTISNITIRYETDNSITIQENYKQKIEVTLTSLGFQSESKRLTWNNFLAVLQSPPNHYWDCSMLGNTKQLKVISDRLITWMTNNLKIKFPDTYKLYNLVKKKKPGTYQFKFNIEYPDIIPEDESSKETFLKKFWKLYENYQKKPNEALMKKLKGMVASGMIKGFITEEEVLDLLKEETPENENNTIVADNLSITNEP
jgi:hypothetical protein